MNKRLLRKALAQNQCRIFAGVIIHLPHDQHHLLDDLFIRLKRLGSDMNKIKPDNIAALFLTYKIIPVGLSIHWVVVPKTQGNLLAKSHDFDEGILQELEEQLIFATLEVVNSIDVGNNLAYESTRSILSADDVIHQLNSSKNPRIARNVAARASGSQITIAFQEGERTLGGHSHGPREFSNTDRFLIEKCQVIRWISDKEVMLWTELLPETDKFNHFLNKNSLSVRVQRGTIDAAIIDCAALANVTLDIEVSIGLILRSGKSPLQLASIQNSASIFDAAQSRLDELRRSY